MLLLLRLSTAAKKPPPWKRQGAAWPAGAMQVQTGAEKQRSPAQKILSSLLIDCPQHRAQDALVQPRVGQQQFKQDALPVLLHRATIIALQAIELNLMCASHRPELQHQASSLYTAPPHKCSRIRQNQHSVSLMLVSCCLCPRLLQPTFETAVSASARCMASAEPGNPPGCLSSSA